MSVTGYGDLLERASHLSPQEKVSLIAELASQVRENSRKDGKRSIVELRGLGKEIWQDVDVQEYIDRERASWNG